MGAEARVVHSADPDPPVDPVVGPDPDSVVGPADSVVGPDPDSAAADHPGFAVAAPVAGPADLSTA